jgi:3-hydroxy acid dehydrogenase / malonic semialdehyde reductase
MTKTAFITGASSGFGEACATLFAQNGYQLIITARRKERLQQLQANLQKNYNVNVHTLCFDVQDKTAVFSTIQSLPKTITQIDVLINNAGLALGRDNFATANIEDWDTMIDTNVKGLWYVTKALLPFFIQQQFGQIVNVGSIAAKEPYQNGNAYCASKAAVDMLTKNMRIDLLQHHIKVSAIHPGAANTEFSLVRFKGNKTQADATYENFCALYATDVANTVLYICSQPKHVCINDLVIMPTQQASATIFNKSGML